VEVYDEGKLRVSIQEAIASACQYASSHPGASSHTVVIEVAAHSQASSLCRGQPARVMLNRDDSVSFVDVFRMVASPLSSDHLRVLLNFTSCYVPGSCMETSRELAKLTLSHPHIEVITHGFLVTELEALLFNAQLFASLLGGKPTREALSHNPRALFFQAGVKHANHKKDPSRFARLEDESVAGVSTLRARAGPNVKLYVLEGSTPEERQRMVNEDGLTTAEHRKLGIKNAKTVLEKTKASVFRAHGIVVEGDLEKFV
jgi:hypothetical protein